MLDQSTLIGVLGAGTMGSGIAQVAAGAGHRVVLADSYPAAIEKARESHAKAIAREVERRRLTVAQADDVLGRLRYVAPEPGDMTAFAGTGLVIEAVVEDPSVKRDAFRRLEEAVGPDAILATNTSSLSVTGIAAACQRPDRVVGTHFFNPAPLLPLVEIVPGLTTSEATTAAARELVDRWGKTTVRAADTPGFIVNRIARPFYGEALRIYEEGIADRATIDWAMRDVGGFRMGPFELMDLIGNDVNYTVSLSVFEAFGYDPRYRPFLTQRRLVEAGLLGRKSGQGHYDYRPGAPKPEPVKDHALGAAIFDRIVVALVNSAIDALFWKVATRDDIDLAMTKGVNYPKGLLRWADEIGLSTLLERLEQLHRHYGDERYQPSPLLRQMALNDQTFYS